MDEFKGVVFETDKLEYRDLYWKQFLPLLSYQVFDWNVESESS